MKRLRRLSPVFLALALLLTAALPVWAAMPERPSNLYVLDEAGVLSDSTERTIIEENDTLFNATGAEIVVAAVDFLGGKEIDDYTYRLFNDWGVGSAERNNGLLLVLAIEEDNYYAQAGYGIEDYFDGAKLQKLLDENLEDAFAAGDYDTGVRKFFLAALSEMNSYYGSETGTPGLVVQEESSHGFGLAVLGWIVPMLVRVIIAIVLIAVVIAVVRAISRGGGGGYGGAGSGFWSGMLVGRMTSPRRQRWGAPPPPPPPPRPPRSPRPPRRSGGFGGYGGGRSSGGFSRGGSAPRPRSSGGISRGGGGFSRGGGSRGGGAGRR